MRDTQPILRGTRIGSGGFPPFYEERAYKYNGDEPFIPKPKPEEKEGEPCKQQS